MTKTGPTIVQLNEPNQIAQVTPWDLDFRQIAAGSGQTDLALRAGRFVNAVSVEMRCKVHQVGASPPGLITLGIGQAGSIASWRGVDAPDHPLICFGSGHAFDGVSRAGFKAMTLSLSQSELCQLAEDFGLEINDRVFQPGLLDLARGSRAARRLARKATLFMAGDAAMSDPDLEDDIGLAVLISLGATRIEADRPMPRRRDTALGRALDVIAAHVDDPPSIRALCARSGVSWPTLHRAFADRFGIGPKMYLSTLRLNRARSELLAAGDGTRVADVANALGFWHMGQFARDYRKLFNRLPSEDLKTVA